MLFSATAASNLRFEFICNRMYSLKLVKFSTIHSTPTMFAINRSKINFSNACVLFLFCCSACLFLFEIVKYRLLKCHSFGKTQNFIRLVRSDISPPSVMSTFNVGQSMSLAHFRFSNRHMLNVNKPKKINSNSMHSLAETDFHVD